MALGVKTGGRKKGVPNKLTTSIKEMIIKALDDVGGVEYLKKQSMLNPTAFMTLVGKVLPLTVIGDKENPLEINHTTTPSDQDLIHRYLKQKDAPQNDRTIN